jgi:YfiH family protein
VEHSFGTAIASPAPGYKLLHQIHSARVLEARECGPGVEGDALITRDHGVFIGVKTADCVPLLIADPVQRAVAAVHAGWRGTLSAIAVTAITRMGEAFGSRPEDLVVAMGPSIGECCFEVGPEVAVEFGGIFPERGDLHQKTTLDLREANLRQLLSAGVPGSRIDAGPPCTCCGGAEFYSWRRDGVPGQRMFTAIGSISASETRRR